MDSSAENLSVDASKPDASVVPSVAWAQAWRFWLKLGLLSFGGPAGQIAMMHQELVEKKRWVAAEDFMNGLHVCMLLPGPEAHQLAIYLGWRLHGWRGGCVAGLCFVLPAALLLLLLSVLYVLGEKMALLQAVLRGGMAAVLALIGMALWRMGCQALRTRWHVVVAGAAFVLMLTTQVSFLWMLLVAAVGGAWRGLDGGATGGDVSSSSQSMPLTAPREDSWRRAAGVLLIGGALWLLPLLLMQLWLGVQATAVQQGWFFSQAALVTFGGAYAVLPYVAQQAVEHYGWLSHVQMLSGLALAEITPGPLIIVLQFVGFVGSWQHPGELSTWTSGLLGAFITTWCTFVPSFVMIFTLAPWVGRWSKWPRWNAALASITAVVVGVMAHLATKLAHQILWAGGEERRWQDFDVKMVLLFALAFLALRLVKAPVVLVIIACGASGALLW